MIRGAATRDGSRTDSPSDAGFSLTELAVYIVLLGIITAVISAVILTSFRAEETVSTTTNMANDAQSVIANLDRDIRNSPVITPSSGVTDTIWLCVAGAGVDVSWHSLEWSFSNSTVTRSVDGGAAATVSAAPLRVGTFEISGDLVTYSFELVEAGTSRTFTGTTALSPAAEAGCS